MQQGHVDVELQGDILDEIDKSLRGDRFMPSHEDVIKRFEEGNRTGYSYSMEIVSKKGLTTYLVGYDDLLYAERDEHGNITVYEGWSGYTKPVTRHMEMLRELLPGAKFVETRKLYKENNE